MSEYVESTTTVRGYTVKIIQDDTDARNRETEAREIEWLRTAPDRVFLYVKHGATISGETDHVCQIGTWLGTTVSETASMGPRRYVGFNGGFYKHVYRRAVTCHIFGVLYHGWYMESSGNYCRLKKAKRQK